jgi:hypothetical protein
MYLIVKTIRGSAGTSQKIEAAATDEALEDYVMRHGLTDCEVYEASKLQFNITWGKKERTNVSSN